MSDNELLLSLTWSRFSGWKYSRARVGGAPGRPSRRPGSWQLRRQSAVARRHGLTPQQLFTWRRQSEAGTNAVAFAPVAMAAAVGAGRPQRIAEPERR